MARKLTKAHRILVVEDDDMMLTALAASLERAGFEVMGVSTFKEATDALARGTFSAVVTDIYLPDGDGLGVFAAAQRSEPVVPVIGMTAYIDTELGRKAEAMFGDLLFEKPLKKEVFIDKIRETATS